MVGDKAKNYTLVGESHKFLVKLNERFKAKTKITNKLNALQRSGKKVVTGATQAMPKVAALAPPSAPNVSVSTPSPGGGATPALLQQQLAPHHQLEDLLLKQEIVVVEVQVAQVLQEVKPVATNLLQMKITKRKLIIKFIIINITPFSNLLQSILATFTPVNS